MARPLSHTIVASKMDILRKQRNYLQTFVDETDKVLQMATSWLENEDSSKSLTSSDMNKMIDDKLAFLLSTDFSVECEEAATKQEPEATRSFPLAPKSTDQPLPAGHVHVSRVTVAPDELKTILSQVTEMQDAMSFLSTSSKVLSEKQLAMEKLVESLSDKYSKVEQEKLRATEGELEGIKEKHEKAALQQDKIMTSFEKKIQDLTDTQSDIVESCHQQQIKIKDQKKETEKLKTQSQQFTKDLRDVLKNIQELNAQISALEKKAFTNTQFDDLEEKVQSLEVSSRDLSVKLEEKSSELEKEKPDKVTTEQDRMTSFEKKIQDLADSQSDIVENYYKQQSRINNYKKQNEKLKTQSQEFTNNLSNVVENVEKLNTGINALDNKIIANAQDSTKNLNNVVENVQKLNTGIITLENKIIANAQESTKDLMDGFEIINKHIKTLEKETSINPQLDEMKDKVEFLELRLGTLTKRFEESSSSLKEQTQREEKTLKVLSGELEKLQKSGQKVSTLRNNGRETEVDGEKLSTDVTTKLDNVCEQMAELWLIKDKLSHIEQQTQVGFSAELSFWGKTFTDEEPLVFPDVTSNIGDHYDYKTGEFTAPSDGLYAVYFSVDTLEGDCQAFGIIKHPCFCEHTCSNCVCGMTDNKVGMAQARTFGLVELKASDKLFVKCMEVRRSILFSISSRFICLKMF